MLWHAYLIPYGKDCQLVIGFKGLLAIARRSGEIGSISVRVVYARDIFEVSYGDEEKIVHIPFQPKVKFSEKGEPIGFDGPENAGNVVAAYMIAHLKDGSVQREVMNVADIMAIKSRSRSGSSGPWKTDFAEMARKTVFRRGWKWLPQSTEMAKAVEYDDDKPEELGAGARPTIDVSFQMTPPPTRGDAMAAELEAKAEQPAQGGAETSLQEPAAAAPASEPAKRPDVAEADAPPDVRGDFE